MYLICQTDPRRDAVRRRQGRNGLDYVEVGGGGDNNDARTLYVYFLGKLPRELSVNRPGVERYLQIEGGERIKDLRILDADPQVQSDPERDDVLVLTLDRVGDFSPYTLRLVDVEGVDPRYDSTTFSFRIDCPNELDCRADCGCESLQLDEPQINYLGKDYGSFRQLIYDRMALLVPGWTERHVPDLGVTLVELLAYVGDQLSYYQDAVATEAYLGTARQRISVRRHARLVDYVMHEGCNARAWLHLRVTGNPKLPSNGIAFVTGYNQELTATQTVLTIDELDKLPVGGYEFYEPLVADAPQTLWLREAHNDIFFYAWGRRECCLEAGATSATLLDRRTRPSQAGGVVGRALNLRLGEVLIFEEARGAKTGVTADKDPQHRCAVRLTRITPGEDSLYPASPEEGGGQGGYAEDLPTPIVEIEWAAEDALPFSLCLSAIGAAPDCAYLTDVTVAHGNVILIDHGRTVGETLPPVPAVTAPSCCECEGEPSDVQTRPGRYRPPLSQSPVAYSEPLHRPAEAASKSLIQDPRAAVPSVSLSDDSCVRWNVQGDLIGSGPDDRCFVVEIDNRGIAHLRFGDGELGRQPAVGNRLAATYRIGGGVAGNVGAEAISRLVLKEKLSIDGGIGSVRNPLLAVGGIDPEPIEEARLFAPAAFRKQIERAVIAADYAELAERNAKLQRATARLAWTGSWYEADVSVDPYGTEHVEDALLKAIGCDLYRYRRMGHDLRVQPARYVPLKLSIEVCALPGYDRGHVKAALLARFGNRNGAGHTRGFFHPDEISLGDSIRLSSIIATAQAVAGVECVTVTQFQRLFGAPNQEIQNGVLPISAYEIAQLDNDPNHPERGQLRVEVRGGR